MKFHNSGVEFAHRRMA